MNLVQQIAEIAREIESEDPIDWAMLTVDEETVYEMMASSVLENYLSNSKEDREMIMLGTITHLVVENFVLNLKAITKT